MKTLILLLLFSFSASASAPQGLFQVSSNFSHISWKEHKEKVSGLIQLAHNFRESKFKIESPETVFESEEINGEINNFKVKGMLQHKGKSYPLNFSGKYFGSTSNHIGNQKIALKLIHNKLQIVLFASRPAENTSALYKEVRGIIR